MTPGQRRLLAWETARFFLRCLGWLPTRPSRVLPWLTSVRGRGRGRAAPAWRQVVVKSDRRGALFRADLIVWTGNWSK
eukprot:gene14735-biopygen593